MTVVKRNEWYKIEPTGLFIAEDIIEVNCILLWDCDIGCLEKIGNYEDTGTENVHSQTLKNEKNPRDIQSLRGFCNTMKQFIIPKNEYTEKVKKYLNK